MVVVGLDEAGTGACFGSAWAAAVHLDRPIEGLADSKKLTEKRRDRLRTEVLASAYGLGEVTSVEIDTLGLGEARRLLFDRALDDYARRNPDRFPTELIVDGDLFRPWRGVPHTLLPRADATIPCVSAASVLAKTTRDRQVVALCDADPDLYEPYGIRANKGYLTPAHIEAIRVRGRTPAHRHSYHIRALAF
jgi:ribonuclease HII